MMAGLYSESVQAVLPRPFAETLAAQMFYDHIHVGFIDGTKAHVQGLFVDVRYRYGYVIGLVEVGMIRLTKLALALWFLSTKSLMMSKGRNSLWE